MCSRESSESGKLFALPPMNRPFLEEVLEVIPERFKQAQHELFPSSTPHIMTYIGIRGIFLFILGISFGMVCLGPVLSALFSMDRLYIQSLSFGASGDTTMTLCTIWRDVALCPGQL